MASNIVGQKSVLYAKRDRAIKFNELSHTYFVYNNRIPISVTGLIKTLDNPFNRRRLSSYLGWRRHKKLSLRTRDAIFYVRSEFNYAQLLGTLIHKQIEVFLCNKYEQVECMEHIYEPGISSVARAAFDIKYPLAFANFTIQNAFAAFMDFYDKYLKHFELIGSEYMIWGSNCNGRLLAGRIDALFWSNRKKREVVIVDWTTSRNMLNRRRVINASSPFNGKMRRKLDNKFCQLHMYSAILERYYNVTVTQAIVVQFWSGKYTAHYAPEFETCECITA